MRYFRHLTILIIALALIACGGNELSSSSPSNTGISSEVLISSSVTQVNSSSVVVTQSSAESSSQIASISSSSPVSSSSTSSAPDVAKPLPSGRYSIYSRLNDLPLEISEYSYDNGAIARIHERLGLLNQRFDVVDLENGYYAIMPAHSGKSLDVWDRSMDNGGEIKQYDYSGESQQQWQIASAGNGYYRITSKLSGKSLDVWQNNIEPGTPVRQSTYSNSESQQWQFSPEPLPHNFTNLVWSEEFNYEGLPDTSIWNYENGMVRNNEAQFYTMARPENVDVRNGVLTITSRRETYETAQYTSASLHTRDKLSWTYGRFEIRAKLDTRAGLWPAFWMLGPGKWPEGGEIDIMEYYNDKILANVAWKSGSSDAWNASWDSSTRELRRLRFQHPDWSDRFHIFRMDWDTNEIRLYVDGLLMNSTKLDDVKNPDGSNPFRGKAFYLLINLAIGGNNGGDPSATSFPATYEIDYVRVYQ